MFEEIVFFVLGSHYANRTFYILFLCIFVLAIISGSRVMFYSERPLTPPPPPECGAVFRRTWTDAEELLKENFFFILSFVFLSEFVIRQVQTNIF